MARILQEIAIWQEMNRARYSSNRTSNNYKKDGNYTNRARK